MDILGIWLESSLLKSLRFPNFDYGWYNNDDYDCNSYQGHDHDHDSSHGMAMVIRWSLIIMAWLPSVDIAHPMVVIIIAYHWSKDGMVLCNCQSLVGAHLMVLVIERYDAHHMITLYSSYDNIMFIIW